MPTSLCTFSTGSDTIDTVGFNVTRPRLSTFFLVIQNTTVIISKIILDQFVLSVESVC